MTQHIEVEPEGSLAPVANLEENRVMRLPWSLLLPASGIQAAMDDAVDTKQVLGYVQPTQPERGSLICSFPRPYEVSDALRIFHEGAVNWLTLDQELLYVLWSFFPRNWRGYCSISNPQIAKGMEIIIREAGENV